MHSNPISMIPSLSPASSVIPNPASHHPLYNPNPNAHSLSLPAILSPHPSSNTAPNIAVLPKKSASPRLPPPQYHPPPPQPHLPKENDFKMILNSSTSSMSNSTPMMAPLLQVKKEELNSPPPTSRLSLSSSHSVPQQFQQSPSSMSSVASILSIPHHTHHPHHLQQPSSPPSPPSPPSAGSVASCAMLPNISSNYALSLSAQRKLTGIHTFSTQLLKEWMCSLFKKQFMCIQQQQQADLSPLFCEQKTMLMYIDSQVGMLNSLLSTAICNPPVLNNILGIRDELRLYVHQISLFQQELMELKKPGAPAHPIASLVIRKQPFPFVLMNGKQLGDEELEVQLLTGAAHKLDKSFKNTSYIVKATLLGDKPQAGRGPSLENNVQTLNENGVASFPIRFPIGTHRSVVHLKFTMAMKDSSSLIER